MRRLADSRQTTPEQAKELSKRGKAVLVVTCNIHSTEIASSQSAAEFVYRLATQDTPEVKQILDNTIIVLVPSLNPDGEQLVVDWYKKYLGTPYEGSSPVVVYHHYVGHDDNRDWYGFTQVETQLTVDKVINPGTLRFFTTSIRWVLVGRESTFHLGSTLSIQILILYSKAR